MNNKSLDYHDVVHGKIETSPIIEAIIESKMFRRLKYIKQLGGLSFVYPEAIHTRFEHCIGTYHLAQKMLTHLVANTPDLIIPEFYQNCVKIAGLLHDIGHGPFSHFWEDISKISHEDNCKGCIDEIFDEIRKLNYTLSDSEKQHLYGIELIKGLIRGNKSLSRPIEKKYEFIFEIVNNKLCGIDVDKWDYLKRDAYYVAKYVPKTVKYNLNFDEVFTTATVSLDPKYSHILYNYNIFDKIYDIFDTRSKFHIHLYQLPLNMAFEHILKKAVKLADQRGYKFNEKLMSEITSHDKNLYLQLTDNRILKFLREIKDDEIIELVKYIDNKSIIENIANNDQKKIICHFSIKIDHAGEKVDKIPFYGNISDKPKILLKTGYYESKHEFVFK